MYVRLVSFVALLLCVLVVVLCLLDMVTLGIGILVSRGVRIFSFYLFFLSVFITLYYYSFSLPNHYLFRFALLSYLCVWTALILSLPWLPTS